MDNEVSNEIDEMLNTLTSTGDPIVDDEVDDEVTDETPEEDEEVIEGEGEGEDEEGKSNDETTDDDEVVEDDEKDETINLLRNELAEIKKVLAELKGTKEPDPEPEIVDQDFEVTEEDLEELNPAKFNMILNKVYKKAMVDSKQILEEGILKSLPDTIRSQVNAFNSMQKAVDNFYTANKDLAKFKKTVGVVFKEVAAKNPNESFEKILPKVSSIARKKLGLPAKAEDTPPRPPKKNSSGVSRGPKPQKKSSLQDEIDSMSNVLGG